MKTLLIERYTSDRALGTLGKAYFPDPSSLILDYLEPPWTDNRPFVSCVPTGVYAGVFDTSPTYGPVYYLVGGTVARDEESTKFPATRYACIAGHGANWHYQLQGCGAFGQTAIRDHAGKPGDGRRSHYVGRSRDALALAHAALGPDPVIQVIIRQK